MKNCIYIFACLFIFISCKSQEKSIEFERKNIIVFNIDNPQVRINNRQPLLINNNLIFLTDNKYVDIPRPMKLSFLKDKDTMNIILAYGNWGNIYVKNFKFKKGDYRIIATINSNSKKYILNRQDVPKQKIISKNVFIPEENKIKDIELKDMIFYEIDMNDSLKVEFTKIK